MSPPLKEEVQQPKRPVVGHADATVPPPFVHWIVRLCWELDGKFRVIWHDPLAFLETQMTVASFDGRNALAHPSHATDATRNANPTPRTLERCFILILPGYEPRAGGVSQGFGK